MQALPGPTAEPDDFTPAETSTSSSCGAGGEEVWEVQALPEPNAEPDYSTPAETSTFFFLLHRWGRCMGGASAARAEC